MQMKNRKISYLYWLIPLGLLALQIVMTLQSFNQIRYEEVANSVRNPFWLTQRTVYGGASSNVGWEGVLTILYAFFGFSLFMGKYFHVFLALCSLFSLAAILKKYLGEKLAIIPLITIGLSPTLLYFNTIASNYGIDLQYLPIVLFLLDTRFRFLRMLGAFVAMVAWMSYPPFMFYLPVLFILSLRKKIATSLTAPRNDNKWFAMTMVGFLLPLIFVLFYITNTQALINDPVKGSGIFRGGGGIFPPPEGTIDINIKNLLADLFAKGISYNFDLQMGEFSLVFPIVVLLGVLIFGIVAYRKFPKWKFLILGVWVVFLFNFIVYVFFQDLTGMPGIRRGTGMLAAFYVFFALGWYYLNTRSTHVVIPAKTGIQEDSGVARLPRMTKRLPSNVSNDKWRLVGMVILLLLPLHHLIVYPINLSHIPDPTIWQDATGFFQVAKTPVASLATFVQKVQKQDVYLKCQMMSGGQTVNNCRYGEMYTAIIGSCLWNHLSCHSVYGYDWNSEKYILLKNTLWDNNVLEP